MKLFYNDDQLTTVDQTVTGRLGKRRLNDGHGHPAAKRPRSQRKVGFTCSLCLFHCENRKELFHHRMENHFNDSLCENNARFPEPYSWVSETGESNPKLQRVFQDNRGYIFAKPIVDDVRSVFNRTVIAKPESETQQWWQLILDFFRDVSRFHLENSYKFNFGMGFVMRHIDTSEFRYYVAGENGTFFPQPISVSHVEHVGAWVQYQAVHDMGRGIYHQHHHFHLSLELCYGMRGRGTRVCQILTKFDRFGQEYKGEIVYGQLLCLPLFGRPP